MSPHVNNFVTDLVLMAKAMEELPQAQAEIAQLKTVLDQRMDTIQSHELKIIDLKAQLDTAHASIRSLEVARDDAELRFLELEETSNMVRRVLNEISASTANQARQITVTLEKANPPAPEPVCTIQPAEEGSSADRPTDTVSTTTTFPSGSASSAEISEGHVDTSSSWADPSPGQSEADPTAVGQATSEHVSSQPSATSEPAETAESVASTSGKYSGKLYEDHPYYVSLAAWIAGGGTEQDYNARRGMTPAF